MFLYLLPTYTVEFCVLIGLSYGYVASSLLIILLHVLCLFRERIEQFVAAIIAIYYWDEEGICNLLVRFLSTYWLLGCWPSDYHMSLLLIGYFIWFSYIRVHPRHYLLLIVRIVIACILDFNWFMHAFNRSPSHTSSCI